MIRFAVKSAFLLGLASVLLPNLGSGNGEGEGSSFSLYGALHGLQAAASDVSGFCERAPAACETGREAAAFAVSRIGDGASLAYGYVNGRETAPGEPLVVEVMPRSPDPVLTGSLPRDPEALAAPSARTRAAEIVPAASVEGRADAPRDPAPARGPAVADRPQGSDEGILAFGPSPSPAPKPYRAYARIPSADIPSVPMPGTPIPTPAPRA